METEIISKISHGGCTICCKFEECRRQLPDEARQMMGRLVWAFGVLCDGSITEIAHVFCSRSMSLADKQHARGDADAKLVKAGVAKSLIPFYDKVIYLLTDILEMSAVLLTRCMQEHHCELEDVHASLISKQLHCDSDAIKTLAKAASYFSQGTGELVFWEKVFKNYSYYDVTRHFDIRTLSHFDTHIYAHFVIVTRMVASELTPDSKLTFSPISSDPKRTVDPVSRFPGVICTWRMMEEEKKQPLHLYPLTPTNAIFHVEYGTDDGFTIMLPIADWLPLLDQQFGLHRWPKFHVSAVVYQEKTTRNVYTQLPSGPFAEPCISVKGSIELRAFWFPTTMNFHELLKLMTSVIEEKRQPTLEGDILGWFNKGISTAADIETAAQFAHAICTAPNAALMIQKMSAEIHEDETKDKSVTGTEEEKKDAAKPKRKKKSKSKNKKKQEQKTALDANHDVQFVAESAINITSDEWWENEVRECNAADVTRARQIGVCMIGTVAMLCKYHREFKKKAEETAELTKQQQAKEMQELKTEHMSAMGDIHERMWHWKGQCNTLIAQLRLVQAKVDEQAQTIKSLNHDLALLKPSFDTLMELDDHTFKDVETTRMKISETMMRAQSARIERRLKELEAKSKPKECSVCMDKVPDHALQCGHVFCGICAEKVEKCPTCRQEKMIMTRLFM